MVNNFDRRLRESEEAAKAVQSQQDLLRAENAELRAETDRLKKQQANDRTRADDRFDKLTQAQQAVAQALALLSSMPKAASNAQTSPDPAHPMDTSNGGNGI